MLEPVGQLWGKETPEMRLVEQAKETEGTSYFPDFSGHSHWGCASMDSTTPILPATNALLTFLLLLQCLWPVHMQ